MLDGDLQGASFAFSLPDDGSGERWTLERDGSLRREIVSVQTLHDVCICKAGAYPGARSEAVFAGVNELALVA
jgi:phage head maturation protease